MRRPARCASASMRSNCTWPTAICCMSSCRRYRIGATTHTADHSTTGSGFHWRCSPQCATCGHRTGPSAFAFPPPIGLTEDGQSMIRSRSPSACSRWAAIGSTCRAAAFRRHKKSPWGPAIRCRSPRAIRRATSIPTVAVGLITDAKQADRIVRSQDADLVALARAMLWDPRWPWHAAATLGAQVHAPKQYWRSAPRDAGNVIAHAKVGQR